MNTMRNNTPTIGTQRKATHAWVWVVVLLGGLVLAVSGCKHEPILGPMEEEDNGGGGGPDPIDPCDPNIVYFDQQILPILISNCAVPGCHVDGVEPGDMRFDREPMEVWERLVGNPAEEVPTMPRISPDDPLSSYLLLKLVQTTPQVGGQMPLGTAPIEAERAQAILRWILDGAPFN